MTGILNILKLKALTISLGIAIATSIILGPVLKNYVLKTGESVRIEKQEKSEEGKKQQTVITDFQAVTPVAQSDLQPDGTLIEYLTAEFEVVTKQTVVLLQSTAQKLFKILFRLIISPNAP